MSEGAFRKRTAIVLAVICTISLVGLGLLAIFGPELKPTRSGEADVYSMSSVGHGALLDTLEELDVPTAIHRDPKRLPFEGRGVLLVLEPDGHLLKKPGRYRVSLPELVGEVPAVLLALPKWQVELNSDKHPWVTNAAPLSDEDVLAPLEALDISANLIRVRAPTTSAMPTNDFEHQPTFPLEYRQYVSARLLEPLVADEIGTVLGYVEYEGTTIYVLSDPDLLANHGLHHGENASLVMAWLDRLRESGPVVFDETLHGYPPRDTGLLRQLFRFPLILVLAHVLVIVALVLWAGLGRFGDSPPPSSGIEPGSGFLIRHTAWLLQFGSHTDMALRRYAEDVARDVSDRFHFPSGLSREQRDARLDELGASRGTRGTWSELRIRALEASTARGPRRDVEALRAAHALYEWKQEILDGPRSNQRTASPVA